MTTHDQLTETVEPLEREDTTEPTPAEPTLVAAENDAVEPAPVATAPTERVEPLEQRDTAEPTTAEPTFVSAESEAVEPAPVTSTPTETAEPSPDESLFDADKLSGLRSRWTDIQAEFVDDPRQCVQNADGLVSDVVDQLTARFSAALSRLEEQWARGEEVSTEDLRVALRRYRGFFERLLEV
jgi:hypothetical protein